MSVETPVIDSLDIVEKLIFLKAGVRLFHPVTDIYTEVRNLRRTDETLRGFPIPVTAAGNVAKGGGKFTPRYAIFMDGWRLVPEDTNHTLDITGEQLIEEGGGGPDCLDLSHLSEGTKVLVNYAPPTAEIITSTAPAPEIEASLRRIQSSISALLGLS